MNPPRPRLRLDLRTTSQVLKQSSLSFFSSFYTFLFLSLLLFSFRKVVENGTFFVVTFIDRDPSLRALLSRLDLSGKNSRSPESFRSQTSGYRRRRSFLHFSRVGTLEEDFSSGEEEDYRNLYGLVQKSPANVSSVYLSHFFRHDGELGFSNSDKNDGIRFSEIFGSGFRFKTEGFSLIDDDNSESKETAESEKGKEIDQSEDLRIFIKGLELSRQDAAALFFLVSFLSAAYGWVILGFLVTNSCILGMVFFTVVNDHLGRYNSAFRTVWAGSRLGIRRLSGFILMRWAVRDAMTQILGLWYFGEIEDQHSFFKLFVRLKLLPFSVTSPWIRGYDLEISRFLFTWFLLDTFVALAFAVDCWVAIMDVRSGREVVKEGCYLISTMFSQAIQLKCLEAILCGTAVNWVLASIFGNLFASVFQSMVEVYFMVVWLIYYFATKCKDANSDGRRFGRRNLEDYMNGLR